MTPLQPGEKLYCLSYAPFRGEQSPLDPAMHIPAQQIDDDMARLAKITDCVRTYSVELRPGPGAGDRQAAWV